MMTEEDALAEFLAREKESLAGIDDDFAFDSKDIEEVGDDSKLDEIAPQSNNVSDDSTGGDGQPPSAVKVETSEPESIKAWRKEQEIRLRNKDEKEEAEKNKLKAQAKQELEEWYRQRAEELEKTKKNNRNIEQEFFSKMDNADPGKEWEKIASLCDFNAKTGRNVKDVTRMRSLLLQMKSNRPASDNAQVNGQ